jgi:hypothetical protein
MLNAGIVITPATISRYRSLNRSRIVIRSILTSGLELWSYFNITLCCPDPAGNGQNSKHRQIFILGKVQASVLALHPISLPRAVNDSLQARISGGRMTQSEPVAARRDGPVRVMQNFGR